LASRETAGAAEDQRRKDTQIEPSSQVAKPCQNHQVLERRYLAERRESTQTQSSMKARPELQVLQRPFRNRPVVPCLQCMQPSSGGSDVSSKSISAAERGTDVPKPDDFRTTWRPANSVRFGCPFSAGPPLLQRSLSTGRYLAQKAEIDAQIAELRSMLPGGVRMSPAATPSETGKGKRKKFSLASRRKMAAAQRARYAKLRGDSEPTEAATTRRKHKMSAAGRKAISMAAKKRWKAIKAAKKAA
jgi:hypothetical protein